MPQLPALQTGQGIDLGRTLMVAEQLKSSRQRNRLLQQQAEKEQEFATARGEIVSGEGEISSPAMQKYLAMDPQGGKQIIDALGAMDEQERKKIKEQNAQTASLLLSVESLPPDQRAMGYAQVLTQAESMGIPIENAPRQYDPMYTQRQIMLGMGVDEVLEEQQRRYKRKADVVKILTPEGPRYAPKGEAAGKTPYEKPIAVGAKSRLIDPGTQEVLLEAAAPEGGADFGKGIRGRSLSILTNDAAAFGTGLLSPDEEQRFISAAYEYRQPQQWTDPDTGLVQTRRSELPPYVRQAFEQRGMELPAARQAGSATQPVGGGPAAAPGAPAVPPAAPAGGLVSPAAAAEPAAAAPPAVGPDQKIFDLAFATGPVPAAGRALAATPGVGQLIDAPQWTQAQKFMEGARDDLTRVLQNSPRYAQGERNQIREEIADVTARVWDDPSAFQDRLVGIDDFLQVRLRNALRTAASDKVSRQERQHAMDVANGIRNFREVLGVPQRVRTLEEARRLPPGTRFITPGGKLKFVPEAQ